MDAIYNEFTVNGASFEHIQCIWTPFTEIHCKWNFVSPYTMYMDLIYSEVIVNGASVDHIQCIWMPFTVKSL